MQLSGEGSIFGGHSHHRHRHYLWRILLPTTPLTPSLTFSAEIVTIKINPPEVALSAVLAELLLLGKPKCNGRGAEALLEGPTAGVRGRLPDYYSPASVTGGGNGRQSQRG